MDIDRSWLDTAEAIAREAGAVLMEGWRGALRVERKGRIDLVTDYDLKTEQLLRARLRDAFPEHGWVGEEGEAEATDAPLVWYVDPLDGTTNFAHGHFVFAVSIGLACRTESGPVPLLGVVHAPALGVTWKGGPDLGAFRNGEPTRVTATGALDEALVASGFPYDRATSDDDNLREAQAIIPRLQGFRRCGAAAVDLCLVADGTYDGYWEQKLSPWDVCAGLAIAEAAGAVNTDYEGRPARATTTRLIVANPRLHPALRAAIDAARQSLP